jgi:hypothetical protein
MEVDGKMKKVLLLSLTVLLVVGILVSACSRKRTITAADGDMTTNTPVNTQVVGTKTITITPTVTMTVTMTITPSNTVNPLFTKTSTETITETETVSKTATVSATITETATGTASATVTETETVTTYAHAGQPGWVDDCEDTYGPNQNDFNTSGPGLNVGGYWITYDDRANTGTSYVWPMSAPWAEVHGLPHGTMDVPFQMSSPGYTGSPYGTAFAARMTGYVTTATSGQYPILPLPDGAGYQYGFIGMGTQMTPTAGEPNCVGVDLTSMGFTGIRFWCKGDGRAYCVKLPYTKGAPEGFTRCDSSQYAPSIDGNDDRKITFTANATWGMFQVPFTSLTQEGWGTAAAIANVLTRVKQIQWQTFGQTTGANGNVYPHVTELWIDDVQFY